MAPMRAVGEPHGATVRREAGAVGAADTLEKLGDAEIRIQSANGRDRRQTGLVHSTRHEPALPVGAAVVQPRGRLVWLEGSDKVAPTAGQIEEREAVGEPCDELVPALAGPVGEAADTPRHRVRFRAGLLTPCPDGPTVDVGPVNIRCWADQNTPSPCSFLQSISGSARTSFLPISEISDGS